MINPQTTRLQPRSGFTTPRKSGSSTTDRPWFRPHEIPPPYLAGGISTVEYPGEPRCSRVVDSVRVFALPDHCLDPTTSTPSDISNSLAYQQILVTELILRPRNSTMRRIVTLPVDSPARRDHSPPFRIGELLEIDDVQAAQLPFVSDSIGISLPPPGPAFYKP